MKALFTCLALLSLLALQSSADTIIIIHELPLPHLSYSPAGEDVEIEFGAAKARVLGISAIKKATAIETENGTVIVFQYGYYGNAKTGDCVAFVTLDPKLTQIKSVVDWRPRDANCELIGWTPEKSSVQFKFETGAKNDIQSAFQVDFDAEGNPTWRYSHPCWDGKNHAFNAVSEKLHPGQWIKLFSDKDKKPRESDCYEAFLRNSPDSPRDEQEADRQNP